MVRIRLTVAAALACACGDDVEPLNGAIDECGYDGRSCAVELALNGAVDILFVVDRSARMGPAQAKLARAMPDLVAAIDELPAGTSARVAFTKAEAPVPPCPGVALPELALRSCREHLDDFVRDDGADARASACTDVCTLDAITPSGGPWIEWDATGSNVGDLDVAAALSCAAPQGIAGCDFPAPIGATESAYYDFGPTSLALIVIVSDAADCTLQGDGDLVFDPDSNRTFWTDPTANEPMPAICWNAGVTCTGPATGYDGCEIAYKDFAGEPSSKDRVLATSQGVLSGWRTDVIGIVGVPEGWQRGDAIPYAEASDPVVQREYGIGPACTASDGSFGLPSPRVRAFVEANPYDPGHGTDLFSICANDWGPTMRAIVELARSEMHPTCMPACVADVDPALGVQVDCELSLEHVVDGESVSESLAQCEGASTIPAGAPGCWTPLTEQARSEYCRDTGYNLELELHWPGVIPRDASVSASCKLSDDRERDCPFLP